MKNEFWRSGRPLVIALFFVGLGIAMLDRHSLECRYWGGMVIGWAFGLWWGLYVIPSMRSSVTERKINAKRG